MSKCTKVKRPCKICLGSVTTRNGLQCQGACHSWVHYSCLNYTPGKIKDIRNGVIKVTCPCPDCKTILPKEYRTDQSYSCSNQQCPANRPPKCENMKCPINDDERRAVPKPSCPLSTCGTSCKQHSTPQLPYVNLPQLPMSPCVPLPPQPKPCPSRSDSCFNPNKCGSGCSSTSAPPKSDGDCCSGSSSGAPSFGAVEDMCNTIGLLATQLNSLMNKMQNAPQPLYDVSGGVQRGYRPGLNPNTQLPPPPPMPRSSSSCCCKGKSKKRLI